ncbi:MAG: hypothetical protein GY810_18690 [Aureispira sp.]|nr:hypothetical protein [Aureispira sp.]
MTKFILGGALPILLILIGILNSDKHIELNSPKASIEKIDSTCPKLNFDSLANLNITTPCGECKLSIHAKGMVTKVKLPKEAEKTLFLTFDACGQGGLSDGYDSLLVNFLIEEQIPVTFFISRRWALKNPKQLNYLIENGENIDIFENFGKVQSQDLK